jgi:hypothetical protein
MTQLIALTEIKYVYAHNLSGFDVILLLRYLLDIPNLDVVPLMYHGKLMSIKIVVKSKNINGTEVRRVIIFKDSYLLLPLSLRNLCDAFGITL